jgi:hypothetical protein
VCDWCQSSAKHSLVKSFFGNLVKGHGVISVGAGAVKT